MHSSQALELCKQFNPKHVCAPLKKIHLFEIDICDMIISCAKTCQYIQVHHATWVIGSRFRSKVKTLHAQPTSLLKGETKSGGPSGMSWQHAFSSAPRPSLYRSLSAWSKDCFTKTAIQGSKVPPPLRCSVRIQDCPASCHLHVQHPCRNP